MVKSYQGYICPNPECSGSMRVITTGRANDGLYVVRARKCTNCGLSFVTAEVRVEGTIGLQSVERFDEDQLYAKHMRRREKSGYHGLKTACPLEPQRIGRENKRLTLLSRKKLCKHDHHR